MKILLKPMITFLLIIGMVYTIVFSARAGEVMEQVEQVMPVLKGNTWVKMSDDEKISFIWGAGHIVSIEEVLARQNPELKKSNTFVNKIMEARGNKPMTMNEVAKHVDDYYRANPDKLDKPVVEVIWYETIVPRLKTTESSGKSAN
jgi:hypothetical protein